MWAFLQLPVSNQGPPFVSVGVQVFDFFNREVTKANCFQTKEVYSVSQDLLSVLDGESRHRRLFSRNSLTSRLAFAAEHLLITYFTTASTWNLCKISFADGLS